MIVYCSNAYLSVFLFAGDAAWKKIFYRIIDTMPGDDGVRLKRIEEDVFQKLVKKQICKNEDLWTGSIEQNRVASFQISQYVKSSFKAYEKTRSLICKSYFKF